MIRLTLRNLDLVTRPLLKTFVECPYGKILFNKNVFFYRGIMYILLKLLISKSNKLGISNSFLS